MKKTTRVLIGLATALAVILPASAANARICIENGNPACNLPNCCMLA